MAIPLNEAQVSDAELPFSANLKGGRGSITALDEVTSMQAQSQPDAG
ncbi:hypothetical protein [Burkholderia lata]|nr:hypothetical protein [Burkholderia lata]